MIKPYILFPGLAIAIIDMTIGWKLTTKSNKIGFPLIYHGITLILLSTVLTFINIKENLLFVMFFSIFYIVSLIWICNVRIHQKKSNLYRQEQKIHSNWK